MGCVVEYRDFTQEKIQTHRNVTKGQKVIVSNDGFRSYFRPTMCLRCIEKLVKSSTDMYAVCNSTWSGCCQTELGSSYFLCFPGEKPFACNEGGCNRTFTTQYSLKSHRKGHSKDETAQAAGHDTQPATPNKVGSRTVVCRSVGNRRFFNGRWTVLLDGDCREIVLYSVLKSVRGGFFDGSALDRLHR